MGKISQIHSELEEQAAALGFESLEMAREAGCEVEWHKDSAELVEPLEAAHRAWEKEKAEVLGIVDRLENAIRSLYEGEEFNPDVAAVALDGRIDAPFRYSDVLKIKRFIEKGEMQ